MKGYGTNLTNNKGVTLIELLLGLVVSSIVGIVIYSIFITGITNYQAISEEAKLRSEADIVLATILNRMYDSPIDQIKQEDDKEIALQQIQSIEFEADGILAIHSENSSTTFTLENDKFKINSETINNEEFLIITERSSIVACEEFQTCQDGIFLITLVLKHSGQTKRDIEIEVSSSFGF